MSDKKQQTAVEYLFEQLWEEPKDKLTWHTILNKSKEKFEQQIIDAYEVSHISMMTSEQYYKETYENK
jgi:3-methyladenine DNA glycosylase Tag